MYLKELRDMIAFEAKLSDSIDTLGGWLDTTMAEIFDSYTSQVKYDELFVPNVELELPDATGVIPLPSDVQHLDISNIRFRQNGDDTGDYILYPDAKRFWGDNVGRARLIMTNSSGSNLRQLKLWPTDELTTDDSVIINYWRKAIPPASADDLVLEPDQLVPVVKLAMIARATLFGSSKQYQIFKQESRDAHSRSMGATELGSTNG